MTTTHALSASDLDFRSEFERCAIAPADFNHAAHVRLAYCYLVDGDVESAVGRMRRALLTFIGHNGIPPSKYHETMTRAWILAVRHFMSRGPATSAADFISRNPRLLDTKIMLTHYSAEVLFSDGARTGFVEPNLDPIPRD